jgi:HSP20 family molecular chaperone IbpA
MTEEQKKAPVKAIAKSEIAVKPVKHVLAKPVPAKVPAKQVPAVHVLTTFDNLMNDFRKNFIESIAFPFEWISVEPVVPVREATVDLVDEGNKFVVHAEMPGVAKDKIDVAF